MIKNGKKAIAATMFAAIALSLTILTSCEGRKMSNMTPTGDTVEVEIEHPQETPDTTAVI
ncbi:MAG: hypothetical protein ACI4AK_07350 [Lepagella sp.]